MYTDSLIVLHFSSDVFVTIKKHKSYFTFSQIMHITDNTEGAKECIFVKNSSRTLLKLLSYTPQEADRNL